MRALDYTGVAMVEFRTDPKSGRSIFIEVNGRFWGSLPVALAAGVDFPLYLYQMLVEGRREFPRRYPVGVHSRNLFPDIRWLLGNLKADRSDPLLQTRSLWKVAAEPLNVLLGREHVDTLVADDPAPGVGECAEILRTVFRKAGSVLTCACRRSPVARTIATARARRAARRARSVLFVCKGNICHSPFAELCARREIPGLEAIESAGYYPVADRPSPDNACTAAAEHGIELRSHRSRLLDDEAVSRADVVFVFDEENRIRVLRDHRSARGKVHLLGALRSGGDNVIEDPYSGEVDRFLATYALIAEAIAELKVCLASNPR